MKKILFLILAIMLLAVTVQADECVECGTIFRLTSYIDLTTVHLNRHDKSKQLKALTVSNPYRCIPGDYVKVLENNQGNYYLVKSAMLTGTVLDTRYIKGKTIVRFTDNRQYPLDGYQKILPESEITLIPDCDNKYSIMEVAE